MTHPMKLMDDAIQSALIGHVSLNQLAKTKVFSLQAPPGSIIPYVVFQAVGGGWTNTSPRDDLDVLYQVIGWSMNQAEAYKLAEYIVAALEGVPLSLPGWSCYALTVERFISRTEWSDGAQLFGIGSTFEVQADRSP